MVKLNLEYDDGFNLSVYFHLKKLDENLIKQLKSKVSFFELSGDIPKETRYYLTRETSNLLSILDIDDESDVLEINPCFGAMTEKLCDKARSVTAVEFSKRNASIIKERLSNKDNLEIIVGNLSKIKFNKKFDFIFLPDVLEFSSFFFKTENPYETLLKYMKSLLNPYGKLIIMSFNRFGLKNWAGGYDEHTNKKFDGLECYPKYSLKSFTRKDLSELLMDTDYEDVRFYYPMPSHFYTYAVLSDDYFKQGVVDYNFIKYTDGAYLSDKTSLDNQNILHKICSINEFETFANSFFIIASNEKMDEKMYYSTYVGGVGTNIMVNHAKKLYIKKTPYNEFGEKYLSRMYKFGSAENKRLEEKGIIGIKFNKMTNKQKKDYFVCDYPEGLNLKYLLIDILRTNNTDSLNQFCLDYKEFIYKLYPDTVVTDFSTQNMQEIFGDNQLKKVTCAKNTNYHLGLEEIYNDGGNYLITEYGSICPEYLPLNYLVFAGLYPHLNEHMFRKGTLEALNIDLKEMTTYLKMYSYHVQHPNIDFE